MREHIVKWKKISDDRYRLLPKFCFPGITFDVCRDGSSGRKFVLHGYGVTHDLGFGSYKNKRLRMYSLQSAKNRAEAIASNPAPWLHFVGIDMTKLFVFYKECGFEKLTLDDIFRNTDVRTATETYIEKLREQHRTIRNMHSAFHLDKDEMVGCYHCQLGNEHGERNSEYGRGFAYHVDAGHSPCNGQTNYICRRHLGSQIIFSDIHGVAGTSCALCGKLDCHDLKPFIEGVAHEDCIAKYHKLVEEGRTRDFTAWNDAFFEWMCK